jgi:Lysozyme inhibitor LprI
MLPCKRDTMDAQWEADTVRHQLASALGCAYVVGRELPQKGIAWAYGAWDMARARPVVLRALRRPAGAMRRQIEAAILWRHPHLTPILDTGTTRDLLYYTMPVIEGESLRTRIACEGPLDPHAVADILRDIRGAVAHAHRHRLAYTVDLDNVVVEAANGRNWLNGFGSDGPTDLRSDLDHLDALGWELLLGAPPDPSQLPVRTTPRARPRWAVEDWLVTTGAHISTGWHHVAPHLTPRRTFVALAAVLLLAVLGDRSASADADAAPTIPEAPARISQVRLEPVPVVLRTSLGELATPPPVSNDEQRLDHAYRAVASAFPDAARRELAHAEQVWRADRDRACGHRVGRDKCEHTLTTRRVGELNELLARATGR